MVAHSRAPIDEKGGRKKRNLPLLHCSHSDSTAAYPSYPIQVVQSSNSTQNITLAFQMLNYSVIQPLLKAPP